MSGIKGKFLMIKMINWLIILQYLSSFGRAFSPVNNIRRFVKMKKRGEFNKKSKNYLSLKVSPKARELSIGLVATSAPRMCHCNHTMFSFFYISFPCKCWRKARRRNVSPNYKSVWLVAVGIELMFWMSMKFMIDKYMLRYTVYMCFVQVLS